MEKLYSVKIVEIPYGDAAFKFYRIYTGEKDEADIEANFHGHKYWECHFIEDGNCIFSIEEKEIPMRAGELMIIPPDLGHCSVASRKGVKNYVLEFDVESVRNDKRGFYAIFRHLLERAAEHPVPISEELLQLVRKFRGMSIPVTAEEYCRSTTIAAEIVERLFSELSTKSENDIFKSVVPSSTDFRVLLDVYVGNGNYTLEQIAEILGYSQRHLSRLIYSIYGMSLSDIRNKRGREYAKWRLRNTDFSIDRIALDAGFKSAAAMRESFKKHDGITPQEYRKNYKIL